MQPADNFAQGPSSSFDLNIYNQVEFEGNYNSDNEPQEAAPGPEITGSGYDLNYFNSITINGTQRIRLTGL